MYGRILDFLFDDLVHNSERERLIPLNGLTRTDEVKGRRNANQPWETLSASGTWNDAKLNFGQSKLRASKHKAVVARESDFQSATEGGPVDAGDDRLCKSLNPVEQ
jgi:hypothetical protein